MTWQQSRIGLSEAERFSLVSFQDCQSVSSTVLPRLLAILSEQLYYDEIAIPFTRMQNECKQLIALLADANIDLKDRLNCNVFTIDQASELVSQYTHMCTDKPLTHDYQIGEAP